MNNFNTTNALMNTFETCNRRLEQFLFVHDIFFKEWYKNADGLTCWVYADNMETRDVVEEFRKLDARRREKRLSAGTNASRSQSPFVTRTAPTPARQNKYGPSRDNYPNPRDFKRC